MRHLPTQSLATTKILAVAALSLAVSVPLRAQEPAAQGAPAWERREAMVPMRDGVRLFTVVMVPRGATEPLPILLQRTPYGAGGWGENDAVPGPYRELAADGYVFSLQPRCGSTYSRPFPVPGD